MLPTFKIGFKDFKSMRIKTFHWPIISLAICFPCNSKDPVLKCKTSWAPFMRIIFISDYFLLHLFHFEKLPIHIKWNETGCEGEQEWWRNASETHEWVSETASPTQHLFLMDNEILLTIVSRFRNSDFRVQKWNNFCAMNRLKGQKDGEAQLQHAMVLGSPNESIVLRINKKRSTEKR